MNYLIFLFWLEEYEILWQYEENTEGNFYDEVYNLFCPPALFILRELPWMERELGIPFTNFLMGRWCKYIDEIGGLPIENNMR